MEGNVFTMGLLAHHESLKGKRLFELLLDSIVDDEELCEAHMHISGDEDFRLEVEENVDGDVRSICVSVYRMLSEEHVHSSIHAEMDYEQRGGAYYFAGEDSRKMTLADVYSEIMDLIRRVEKIVLG